MHEVTLTSPVGEDGHGCKRRDKCHLSVGSDVIAKMRSERHAYNDMECKQYGFNLVMQALGDQTSRRLVYKIGQIKVCRKFWEFVHCISTNTVDKYKKMIVNNKDVSLPTTRAMPTVPAQCRQFEKADAWFFHLYQSVGEPAPNSILESAPEGPLDIMTFESQLHPL